MPIILSDRPPVQRLGQAARLARHSALYATAGALGKAAALLAVPYLTRQLGPAEYGLTDLATSFAGLLALVVRFSGDIPTMRIAAVEPLHGRRRSYSAFSMATLIVSLVVVLGLLPTADLVGTVLWSAPGTAGLVLAALVLVPVNAMQSALVQILRFEQRPRAFAFVASVDLIAQVALAVLFVWMGAGAIGVIVGYVIGGAIGLGVAVFAVRAYLARQVDYGLCRQIFMEGIPFLPAVVAFYLAESIGRVIAATTLQAADVGQIAIAIRIASVLSLASAAFSAAWGPYGLALRPSKATRVLLGKILSVQVIIVGAGAVFLGALSPELVLYVGGNEFAAAAQVAPGLLLSAGLTSILYLLTTAAGIAFRGRSVAGAFLAGSAVQIVASAILIPALGIGGFAISSVAGRLTATALLARATSDVARVPGLAVLALVVTTAGILWSQALNVTPAFTVYPRALLAVLAVVAGGYGVIAIVRMSRPTGSETTPDFRASSDP